MTFSLEPVIRGLGGSCSQARGKDEFSARRVKAETSMISIDN